MLLNHSGVLGSGYSFSYAHQFDLVPPFIAIIEKIEKFPAAIQFNTVNPDAAGKLTSPIGTNAG